MPLIFKMCGAWFCSNMKKKALRRWSWVSFTEIFLCCFGCPFLYFPRNEDSVSSLANSKYSPKIPLLLSSSSDEGSIEAEGEEALLHDWLSSDERTSSVSPPSLFSGWVHSSFSVRVSSGLHEATWADCFFLALSTCQVNHVIYLWVHNYKHRIQKKNMVIPLYNHVHF